MASFCVDVFNFNPLVGFFHQQALQRAGVNIFPAVDAEKYVSINTKVLSTGLLSNAQGGESSKGDNS